MTGNPETHSSRAADSGGDVSFLFSEVEPMAPNQNNPSLGPLQPGRYGLSTRVGDAVRTAVVVTWWAMAFAASTTVAYLALRGLFYGVGIVLEALGEG